MQVFDGIRLHMLNDKRTSNLITNKRLPPDRMSRDNRLIQFCSLPPHFIEWGGKK